jgi:putative ATP-binding cassette transporter
LPIGTLRQVVAYPAFAGNFTDAQISDALNCVGLAPLAERLEEQHNWSMQLSPGEQQRIAFARALLQQPDWLFLDEATSSLDEDAEQQLYRLLKQHLPQTTIVSIGHRKTLQGLHSRTIELKDDGLGSKILAVA